RILCLSITYSVCCCFCCRPDLLSFPTRRSSDLFTRDLRGGRGGGIVDRRRRPAAGGAAGAHRRALWTGEDDVSDALLEIAGIRVGYPVPGAAARVVVDDLSMSLAPGDIGCLLGASGCGKTTVLRAIAGFEPVQAGSIDVDGVRVAAADVLLPPEKRRVGMMFQDYALFPHLDVDANIAFG